MDKQKKHGWKRELRSSLQRIGRQLRSGFPGGVALLLCMVMLPLAAVTIAEMRGSHAESDSGGETPPYLEDEPVYVDEVGSPSAASAAVSAVSEALSAVAPETSAQILVLERSKSGEQEKITLEEYLVGVILAEMPSSYCAAALQAQAVAARTYCLYRLERNAKTHESGADLCDDYRHCMAYMDPLTAGQEAAAGVRAAVAATTGQVLLYRGELIDAVFHDSSFGYTESALAVWGVDVPYLQSVPTPEIPRTSEVKLEAKEIFDAFGLVLPSEGEPFGGVTEDAAGRALSVRIYEKEFPALQLRNRLGLRSTAFTVTYQQGVYTFTVRGYGHGVGLSQQGAQALALQGNDYSKILLHYYKDCQIKYRSANDQ